MPLTFSEARTILAQYAGRGGRCPTDPEINLFVIQVLQFMLHKGQYGSLRKFCFNAVKGVFTAPFELETPLKVEIGNQVGTVWDRWMEWYTDSALDPNNSFDAARGLVEEPNYYPIAYDPPSCGAKVATYGLCDETEDAFVIVQGVDPTGREIVTVHKGEQIVGEKLSIVKGIKKYSECTFSSITHVLKSRTNGYVQLLWHLPSSNTTGFLSDYSPLEERPAYRRFRVISHQCAPIVKLSVLARIRLKSAYSDNEFIPFDNLYALSLAGQTINLDYNNEVQAASAKEARLNTTIESENSYKRTQTGQVVRMHPVTSAGKIRNIVRRNWSIGRW